MTQPRAHAEEEARAPQSWMTSHSFDDESWFPGDYMDVSFVYDLQCVAAKRGPWEHGWWILGGV